MTVFFCSQLLGCQLVSVWGLKSVRKPCRRKPWTQKTQSNTNKLEAEADGDKKVREPLPVTRHKGTKHKWLERLRIFSRKRLRKALLRQALSSKMAVLKSVIKDCQPNLCWSDICLQRVSSNTAKVLLKCCLSSKSVIKDCWCDGSQECHSRLLNWWQSLKRVSLKTVKDLLKW